MVSTSFPRYHGDGAGVFILSLAQALQRIGVEIDVVAPHAEGFPLRERLGGVIVRRFRYMWPARLQELAYGAGIPVNVRRVPSRILLFPGLMLGLFQAALRGSSGADLLHAHFAQSGLGVVPAARVRGIPSVVTLHNSDMNDEFCPHLLSRVNRMILGESEQVMAVNRDLAEKARRLGVAAERLTVIGNGVDPEHFSPSEPKGIGSKVLFVGRLVPAKGISYLLEAMPSVVEEVSTAQLVLLGDGPLRAALEREASALGVAERVHFLGARPHSEIRHHLAASDVFVLPSLAEGLPTALLEAMACAKAVVATGVGGVPELLSSGVNGIVVPPGDCHGLTQAIVSLLSNPNARHQMGQMARETVMQGYTWDQVAAQTVEVYRRAITGFGGAS